MERVLALVLLLVVSLLAAGAHGAEFTVGDKSGWTFQVNYTQWAAPKTFRVRDTLSFPYTSVHNVLEVSKADYDSCDASKPLQTYSAASPIKLTLSRTGEHWFICGIPGHCDAGMKLPVNVLAAAEAPKASAPPPRRARVAPPPSSLAVSPSPSVTPSQAPSPSPSLTPSPPSPSSTAETPENPTPVFELPPTAAPTFAPASPPNSSAFSKANFGWLAAVVSGFTLVLM